jgi:hypothetical protein
MSKMDIRIIGWIIGLVLLAGTTAIYAQDGGGLLRDAANLRVTLVNPFTGSGITVTVLRIIYVAGGLVLLFAGWSAYRIALGAAGFVVGASFGAGLTANMSPAISLGATILFGVIGGALASFVYLLAVALVGAYIGLLLTGRVLDGVGLGVEGVTLLLIYGGGMVAGAALALALAVELTIILTSAVGAVMLSGGSGLLTTRFGALWTLLLFAVGVGVQIQVARSGGNNPFQRRD